MNLQKVEINGINDIVKLVKVKSIENLHFKGNEQELQQVMDQIIKNNIKVEELNCSHNQLQFLPDNLNNVEKLYCYNNQLQFLPDNLDNLQYLDCSHNQLQYLPILPKLKRSDCSHNQLQYLPDNLNNVEILNCANNLLQQLPVNLTNLQYLNCSNNVIKRLPNLPECFFLYCSNNELTYLPNLPKCTELDCSNNNLTSLGKINNIVKQINVTNNPKNSSKKINCEQIQINHPQAKVFCDGEEEIKMMKFKPSFQDVKLTEDGEEIQVNKKHNELVQYVVKRDMNKNVKQLKDIIEEWKHLEEIQNLEHELDELLSSEIPKNINKILLDMIEEAKDIVSNPQLNQLKTKYLDKIDKLIAEYEDAFDEDYTRKVKNFTNKIKEAETEEELNKIIGVFEKFYKNFMDSLDYVDSDDEVNDKTKSFIKEASSIPLPPSPRRPITVNKQQLKDTLIEKVKRGVNTNIAYDLYNKVENSDDLEEIKSEIDALEPNEVIELFDDLIIDIVDNNDIWKMKSVLKKFKKQDIKDDFQELITEIVMEEDYEKMKSILDDFVKPKTNFAKKFPEARLNKFNNMIPSPYSKLDLFESVEEKPKHSPKLSMFESDEEEQVETNLTKIKQWIEKYYKPGETSESKKEEFQLLFNKLNDDEKEEIEDIISEMKKQYEDTTKKLRQFTMEDVEKHDVNAERQWIVVNGKVIDITDYKYEHPGGDEIITEHAGSDATESFENAYHSKDAIKFLEKHQIGELVEPLKNNKIETIFDSEPEEEPKKIIKKKKRGTRKED